MDRNKNIINEQVEALIVIGELKEALMVLYSSTKRSNIARRKKGKSKRKNSKRIIIWESDELRRIQLNFFRYNNHTKDFNEGLISYNEYTVIKTQIASSILQLVNSKQEFNIENIEEKEDFFNTPSFTSKGDCKIIPLVPKFITGSIIQNYDEVERLDFHYVSVYKNYYSNDLYAFKIVGESMKPIKENMIIISEPIFRWQQIDFGDRYIIITNEEAMFKRILNYNYNNFLLVSDNENYDEQLLEKKEVNLIFKCIDILHPKEVKNTNKREKVLTLWKKLQVYKIRNRL